MATSSTSSTTGGSRWRRPCSATGRSSSGGSSAPTTAGPWRAESRAWSSSCGGDAPRTPRKEQPSPRRPDRRSRAEVVRRIVSRELMAFAYSERAGVVRIALGSVLRSRRVAGGRTLSEVAAEAGLSPAHLSEVERGRKEVSTERLLAVAHALDIRPAEIYAELARLLGAEPEVRTWPEDPPAKLRLATASLPPEALRSVADFSAYLAMANPPPRPKERIGFSTPRR